MIIEYENFHLHTHQSFRFELIETEAPAPAVIKKHFHEMFEVILCSSFSGAITINGQLHQVKAPFLLYLPQFYIHEFQLAQGSFSCFLVHFTRELLQNYSAGDMPQTPLLIELDLSVFSRLWLHFSWFDEIRSGRLEHDFSADVFKLILRYIQTRPPAAVTEEGRAHESGINRFVPLLKHLSQSGIFKFSVTEASALSGISRSHFLTLFKNHFKINYHSFLMERRMNTAKLYLAETLTHINEVADKLDFYNSAHFTKVFKESTGITPRDFRKQSRAPAER